MITASLFALPPGLNITHVAADSGQLVVDVTACALCAACPLCQHPSTHIHSRYHRTLADLPCSGQRVQLRLLVRKFFCDTLDCQRRIFTERFPQFVQPWAHMTERFRQWVEAIGFATNGQAGARLADRLSLPVSPTTVLRRIMARPRPEPTTVTHLGIDDFSFRRGRVFGTILVDLLTHRPIDLLPDRTTEQAARWMRRHPEIRLISRDRASDYAAAAQQAVPQALQVADRFHLVQNLAEAAELILARCRTELRRAYQADLPPPPAAEPRPAPTGPLMLEDWRPFPPADAEQVRLARRAGRQDRYDQIRQLQAQHLSTDAIARRIGLSSRTVQRWLAQGSVPEARQRRKRQSIFDPYAAYVLKRWQEGCRNGGQLWQEIHKQGYAGSARTVYRFLEVLRTGVNPTQLDWNTERPSSAQRSRVDPASVPTTPLENFSSRTAVWLLIRDPDTLDASEAEELRLMRCGSATVETLYQLVQAFVQMVRRRQSAGLDAWLEQVSASKLVELQRFANGIRRDKMAVVAGLREPYSNGVVEGHNTRVKLLKRMMYGRASFALLRQRVLQAA